MLESLYRRVSGHHSLQQVRTRGSPPPQTNGTNPMSLLPRNFAVVHIFQKYYFTKAAEDTPEMHKNLS